VRFCVHIVIPYRVIYNYISVVENQTIFVLLATAIYILPIVCFFITDCFGRRYLKNDSIVNVTTHSTPCTALLWRLGGRRNIFKETRVNKNDVENVAMMNDFRVNYFIFKYSGVVDYYIVIFVFNHQSANNNLSYTDGITKCISTFRLILILKCSRFKFQFLVLSTLLLLYSKGFHPLG